MSSKIINKINNELKSMKKSKGIYAVITSPQDYREVVDGAVKSLTKTSKLEGIYVSVNVNSDILLEKFKKQGANVKKLVMIDSTGEKVNNPQVIVVDQPKSLTALSLVIGETAQAHDFDFIFIDSLSTLLMNNSVEATEKFIYFILNKMRNMHLGSMVIALEDTSSAKLINAVSQFCDKVIRI